jgi:hypothetical protein
LAASIQPPIQKNRQLQCGLSRMSSVF